MEPGVTSKYVDHPNMIKMFEDCRKKFTQIFPDSPPKNLNKLKSPGKTLKKNFHFHFYSV